MLGALCASLPPEVLGERQLALLELFGPALGPEATEALGKQYTSSMVRGCGVCVCVLVLVTMAWRGFGEARDACVWRVLGCCVEGM